MALKKCIFFCFFALVTGFAQPSIKINTQQISLNDKSYLALKIIYHNLSQDTIVTFIQNWRALNIDTTCTTILGFPFIPRLLNRLFFVERGINFESRIGRFEDNYMGNIVTNSFSIIKPRDSLTFLIIFNDSTLINHYVRHGTDLYLMMNWTTYKVFKSIIPLDILSLVGLNYDSIIIPYLPVDTGNEWNTINLKNSAHIIKDLDLNPIDEDELINKLTMIFHTYLFHSTLEL